MPILELIYWGWKSGVKWGRGAVVGTMDELIVYFKDATGKVSHTLIHIDSGATGAQIQALIDAFQAASDAQVEYSERKTTTINASSVAAVPYNSATAPYAKNSYRIAFKWTANIDGNKAYNSMFAPKPGNIKQDSTGNLILDVSKTPVLNIISAAEAVMRNNINSPVTSMDEAIMRIR